MDAQLVICDQVIGDKADMCAKSVRRREMIDIDGGQKTDTLETELKDREQDIYLVLLIDNESVLHEKFND